MDSTAECTDTSKLEDSGVWRRLISYIIEALYSLLTIFTQENREPLQGGNCLDMETESNVLEESPRPPSTPDDDTNPKLPRPTVLPLHTEGAASTLSSDPTERAPEEKDVNSGENGSNLDPFGPCGTKRHGDDIVDDRPTQTVPTTEEPFPVKAALKRSTILEQDKDETTPDHQAHSTLASTRATVGPVVHEEREAHDPPENLEPDQRFSADDDTDSGTVLLHKKMPFPSTHGSTDDDHDEDDVPNMAGPRIDSADLSDEGPVPPDRADSPTPGLDQLDMPCPGILTSEGFSPVALQSDMTGPPDHVEMPTRAPPSDPCIQQSGSRAGREDDADSDGSFYDYTSDAEDDWTDGSHDDECDFGPLDNSELSKKTDLSTPGRPAKGLDWFYGVVLNLDTEQPNLPKVQRILRTLVTTEQAYIKKIRNLEVFRTLIEELERRSKLPAGLSLKMFANIGEIYKLHTQELLPQLILRVQQSERIPEIGGLFVRVGPFLGIYGDYICNTGRCRQLLKEWQRKSADFAQLLQEVNGKILQTGKLQITDFISEPFAHLARYTLILKDYLAHLPVDFMDRPNIQRAIDIISGVLSEVNERVSSEDEKTRMVELRRMLRGQLDIMTLTRKYIKDARLTVLYPRINKFVDGHLILFNDIILVCLIPWHGRGIELRKRITVSSVKVEREDECSFVIYGREGVEVIRESTDKDAEVWIETIRKQVEDSRKQTPNTSTSPDGEVPLGSEAPRLQANANITNCPVCQSRLLKKCYCHACGKIFCPQCCSKYVALKYTGKPNNKKQVCNGCYRLLLIEHPAP